VEEDDVLFVNGSARSVFSNGRLTWFILATTVIVIMPANIADIMVPASDVVTMFWILGTTTSQGAGDNNEKQFVIDTGAYNPSVSIQFPSLSVMLLKCSSIDLQTGWRGSPI
jgi:hypothetical protein